MISKLVKIYVHIIGLRNRINKERIKKRLTDLEQIQSITNIPFEISFKHEMCTKQLSVCTTQKGKVLFSKSWATRYVLTGNPLIYNAFLFALGHEYAHNFDYVDKSLKDKSSKQLVKWAIEVHNDMYSKRRFRFSNQMIEDIIDYRIEDKPKKSKSLINTYSHPSWYKRKLWLTQYDNYNKTLLNDIASEIYSDSKVGKNIIENNQYSNIIDNIFSYYKNVEKTLEI